MTTTPTSWALPTPPDRATTYLRSDRDGSWWKRHDGEWWRAYDQHPPAAVMSWPDLMRDHGPLTDVTDQMRAAPPTVTAAKPAANPTTDLLRRLAGEPELVIDEKFHGAPITAITVMHLLEHVADWLDGHRHLEEAS